MLRWGIRDVTGLNFLLSHGTAILTVDTTANITRGWFSGMILFPFYLEAASHGGWSPFSEPVRASDFPEVKTSKTPECAPNSALETK